MKPEVKWISSYLDEHDIIPEMQLTLDELMAWSTRDHGYESKNLRIAEWNQNQSCFFKTLYYEIVCHIFINCLTNPLGITYQAMMGAIAGDVQCADPLDRAKCAAEVIAIAYQCELIEITKVSDQTMIITTEFELPIQIPEFDKHMPLFRKPSDVAYNPILGNHFKKHEGDVCMDHITRMNAIPLALDFGVISRMVEQPSKPLETDEQEEQWHSFVNGSWDTYKSVSDQGNRFYLEHSVDTRGRTYCNGYYINYQGASFKKAIVQLANKEVVKL